MKYVLFLTIIINLTTIDGLFSQAEVPITFNQQFLLTTQHNINNIAGSPYVFDEFKNGNLYYGGGNNVEQIPLRLNLYTDQLEYKSKDGIMAFGNPERIDSVVFEEDIFIYIQKSPLYKVSGYVKLLNNNLPSVLTKMKVDLFKREDPKPFDIEDPKPDRFERVTDSYYIMISDYEIKKITSVKKLIRYLGSHSSELMDYSKEEGISANDPEELTKFLNYYHELEQEL